MISDHQVRCISRNGLIIYEREVIPQCNFVIDSDIVKSLRKSGPAWPHVRGMEYDWIKQQNYTDQRFIINLTEADLTRWKLACEFLQSVRGVADTVIYEKNHFADYVATEVSDGATSQHYVKERKRFRMPLALGVASAAYGGLPLASLSFHFPTAVERWLWISSAIYIALTGLIPGAIFLHNYIIYLLGQLITSTVGNFESNNNKLSRVVSDLRFIGSIKNSALFRWLMRMMDEIRFDLVLLLAMTFLVAYCFARAFIIVEAFISFRELPLAYYDTPTWSNLIPHI